MTWSRRFDKPIALSDGRIIATLADARVYLLSLPKSAHAIEAFVEALKAVVMAAEGRGPMMHANVAIGRLVNGPAKPRGTPRKKRVKKYHVIR